MIIIINGPLGVGKSEVSWALIKQFDWAIMLDGDFIGASHPFEIHDKQRVVYLYKTIAHLVKFHQSNGYRDFVINYVFEKPESLSLLVELMRTIDKAVFTFRLTANEAAMEKRIRNRGNTEIEWELVRFKELVKIMNAPAVCDQLGIVVETSELDTEQVAQRLFEMAHETMN